MLIIFTPSCYCFGVVEFEVSDGTGVGAVDASRNLHVLRLSHSFFGVLVAKLRGAERHERHETSLTPV